MAIDLHNLKVAIIVDDGFEQVEMTGPREALEEAGAYTEIISTRRGKVKGWNHSAWGDDFVVDKTIEHADPSDYDALLLPGGSKSAGSLSENKKVVEFVRNFFRSGKPVAAICHAPWILEKAGVLKGNKITSYPAIKEDMLNAGAEWTDEPVVEDANLITSRRPRDIPQFNEKMLEQFADAAKVVKD